MGDENKKDSSFSFSGAAKSFAIAAKSKAKKLAKDIGREMSADAEILKPGDATVSFAETNLIGLEKMGQKKGIVWSDLSSEQQQKINKERERVWGKDNL